MMRHTSFLPSPTFEQEQLRAIMSKETIPTSPRQTQGSCLCGKVAYEITGEPLGVAACHCTNCKKASGAPFMWNVILLRNQFRVVSGEDVVKSFDDNGTGSGNTSHRSFCSNCGSSVFINNDGRPEWTIVMTGCMKDVPAEWSPKMELYCKYKAKWLPDVEGVKRFTEGLP